VRRVPGLLVNGVPYDRRPRTLDELESLYDEGLARASALLDQGVPREELYGRLLQEVAAAQPEPIIGPGALDGLGPGERPPFGSPPLIRAPLDRGGHARGPETAPVTIVFLCNFQTRNCATTAATLDEISAAYPEEVRLVFRPLFDPDDRRQDQVRALHRAAVCADQQGAFWAYYDLAFRQAMRGTPDPMPDAELAQELEIDRGAFARCVRSAAATRRASAEGRQARRAGVRHTPSLILGGRLYTGTKSFDELAALVDRELAPGILGRVAPE
jgi:protein-disulfide isomerase